MASAGYRVKVMPTISKLLLIEDSHFGAHVFKSVLKRTQAFKSTAVDVATTVIEAAALIKELDYPLIILDLNLPDGQGLRLVDEVLRISNDAPLIVITGLESPEIANQAISAGAQDYLVKGDFTPAILGRTVRYALQRHEVIVRNKTLCVDLLRKEQELQSKNDKLTRAVNLANEFVDNVSHEFRTPLTVILDHASILKDGLFGDLNLRQSRMVDKIIDRSEDLNNMVNDMLDSSRIQAGILGFQREPCLINEILDRCRSSLELKASLREVTLMIDLPESLPQAFCDPEKAARTITNLANNAIKFCGSPGRVTIQVEHRPTYRDIVVRVKDNGDGLTADEQMIITERFAQLGGKSHTSQGFGLGLSIVKELVDLNLGDFIIESELGLGTTFSFTIPICDPFEVMTRHLKCLTRNRQEIELNVFVAQTGTSHSGQENRELNALWRYLQHKDDLVFEVDSGKWILIMADRKDIGEGFEEVVNQTVASLNHTRITPLPKFSLVPLGTFQIPHETPLVFERTAEFLNKASGSEFDLSLVKIGVEEGDE